MIRSKADLADYLAADFRHYGVPGWRTRFRLTRRVIYWQWLLRRCEYWTNCRRDPVGRVVAKVLQLRVVLLGETQESRPPAEAGGRLALDKGRPQSQDASMTMRGLLQRWTERRHHGVYDEDTDDFVCAADGDMFPCVKVVDAPQSTP